MRAAAAVNSSAFRILQGKCNGMTIFSWRGLQKKRELENSGISDFAG